MFDHTIGEFLCIQSDQPHSDSVDRPSIRDIKQDAALKAVLGLRKLGKPVMEDAVATFDADPKIVAQAYRWAHNDAFRKQFGRGTQPRPRLQHDQTAEDQRGGSIAETVADDSQQAMIEAIEDDYAGELWRLWAEGIDGLTLKQTRQAICLMQQVQWMKDNGRARIPDKFRQQLHRLRKETGLALNPTLL